MMIVIGPLSYVAHVACRQAFMMKCAIYCDFTWSLWLFQWASLQTVCMLICEYPHPYSHSHSHTHRHTRTVNALFYCYFNLWQFYASAQQCSSVESSRVESSSSSPRVDSQIRPHNNNKSGNYCIKCLIYVFSQLFYLWACTVHCSTGFLCASTASLGPLPSPGSPGLGWTLLWGRK